MNKLQVIEFNNQRILTTEQLAEVYETDINNIQKNFSNHKGNFTAGVHYYYLEGEELKAFKNCLNNIQLVNKHTKSLYLWTERGANRHCKILDTDKAWEQFDNLEETYFNVKETRKSLQELSPQLQVLINMELKQKQLETQIQATNKKVDSIKEIVALNPTKWRKDTKTIIDKIALGLGGFEHIGTIREEIYRLLDERYGVSLNTRLTNKKKALALNGVCKSKIDKTNLLDVIGDDKKLIEGYISIIKELAIKYGLVNIAI